MSGRVNEEDDDRVKATTTARDSTSDNNMHSIYFVGRATAFMAKEARKLGIWESGTCEEKIQQL